VGQTRAIRILGLGVALAVVLLLSTPHASAHPIAGAHYSGDVTGAGHIYFDVSASGTQVLNLRVTHIPCDGGWHEVFTWPPSPPWPPSALIMIVGDYFEGTLLDTKVTGEFSPTGGNANGTFLLDLGGGPGGCKSPELPWTANTAVPVGGMAELPDVPGSSAPSYVPSVGLAAAALAALAAGGWRARRRQLR
jgi:hypothetical protein